MGGGRLVIRSSYRMEASRVRHPEWPPKVIGGESQAAESVCQVPDRNAPVGPDDGQPPCPSLDVGSAAPPQGPKNGGGLRVQGPIGDPETITGSNQIQRQSMEAGILYWIRRVVGWTLTINGHIFANVQQGPSPLPNLQTKGGEPITSVSTLVQVGDLNSWSRQTGHPSTVDGQWNNTLVVPSCMSPRAALSPVVQRLGRII